MGPAAAGLCQEGKLQKESFRACVKAGVDISNVLSNNCLAMVNTEPYK